MFLVVEGLLLSENPRRNKDGKTTPATQLGPGNLIGGEAMLLGDIYESTVVLPSERIARRKRLIQGFRQDVVAERREPGSVL